MPVYYLTVEPTENVATIQASACVIVGAVIICVYYLPLEPTENVATIQASACVIEGVSRSRNALINGDTKNRSEERV